MNITFKITTHSLIDGAQVEELLNNSGIKYEMEILGCNKPAKSKKGKTKKFIKPEDIKPIQQFFANHGDWTYGRIGEHFGFSAETVRRVIVGTHPLCS